MPFSTLPPDYEDRVYGGVLGKVIGVYLGRPFEQWSHHQIVERFGEVDYYVNEQAGVPIVVADDDISGTFTFLRALEDNDFDPNLTPEQIGETWLNYIIEDRTVLWWGGRSTSTEHTAFLNLKSGIKAPQSGSIAQNGKTVAEQIGAQIFIDGWGLIHPNDPEAAADWARRAASVSHDGEAIYGAQVIAAMIATAFGESDIQKIQDAALAQIPKDCMIRRLVDDVREMVARESDWREGFQELDRRYGYGVYTSNCHIIPNHGLIHFALLHGQGNFRDSMRVVNTCGWDTDCNAGNLGCILGVRNGAEYFASQEPQWYEPFAGRVIIPTADGGGYATDVDRLTERLTHSAKRLRDLESERPSVRLACTEHPQQPLFSSPTFISPSDLGSTGYGLQASPAVYPGQTLAASFIVNEESDVRLYALAYSKDGTVVERSGPIVRVLPMEVSRLSWTVSGFANQPIFEVGMRSADSRDFRKLVAGTEIHMRVLDTPTFELMKPLDGGGMWLKQWVNGLSELRDWNGMDCVQNEGTGLAIIGCREWQNYRASAMMTFEAAKSSGLAVHVQGMRRYYALTLEPGAVVLKKARDGVHELAKAPMDWGFDQAFELALEVQTDGGAVILKGFVDGKPMLEFTDCERPLVEGAIGIVVTEGRARVESVSISPL